MLLRVRRRKLVFYKEWKILCVPEKKGGKDGGGGAALLFMSRYKPNAHGNDVTMMSLPSL